MEPFIHCRVSLEINKGQMGSSNASDVELFAVKVTPKWMGVNGNANASEVLLQDGSSHWHWLLTEPDQSGKIICAGLSLECVRASVSLSVCVCVCVSAGGRMCALASSLLGIAKCRKLFLASFFELSFSCKCQRPDDTLSHTRLKRIKMKFCVYFSSLLSNIRDWKWKSFYFLLYLSFLESIFKTCPYPLNTHTHTHTHTKSVQRHIW